MNFKKIIDKVNNFSNKQMWMSVFLMFLLSLIFRSILLFTSRSSYVTPDELIYLNMAKSFSQNGKLYIHNLPTVNMAILYSIFISPFMLISNPHIRIIGIGITNILMLASTIVPVYLLCKKIISKNIITLVIMLNILLLPDMTISMTFMAENLFYPISTWIFYIVYKYIITCDIRNKVKYTIIIAIICNILYMIKIISLYFVIAFCLLIIADILFIKLNSYKNNILILLIFIVLFFVVRKAIGILIYEKIFGIYNSPNVPFVLHKINKLPFMIYSFIFNIIGTLMAFFYFPIIIPSINIKKMSKQIKSLYFFSITSLLTIIGTIVLMINVNEQYGVLALRQHIRYYSPLLIIFLIIFYYIMFNIDEKNVISNNYIFILIAFLSLLGINLIFKLFYGVSVDGVLLQYIYFIYKYLVTKNPNNITLYETIIKMIASAYIIFFTVKYTIKNKRAKYKAKVNSNMNFKTNVYIIIVIFIICILNNIFSIISFKDDYKYHDNKVYDKINQIHLIDKYFNNKNDNILIVTKSYNMVIETYFLNQAFFTSTDSLLSLSNNEYINLDKDNIICSYPHKAYTDIDNIDYIITDKSLDIFDMELIEIDGVKDFEIYYKKDSNSINASRLSTFPTILGQEKVLDSASSNIYSNFSKNKDGNYISTEDFSKGNVLVYGPYDYLKKGTYEFTFNYDYLGEELQKDNEIGYVDINVIDKNEAFMKTPIFAGERSVKLSFDVDSDYERVETRIHVSIDNIKFNNIIIKKIK